MIGSPVRYGLDQVTAERGALNLSVAKKQFLSMVRTLPTDSMRSSTRAFAGTWNQRKKQRSSKLLLTVEK